MHHVPEDHPPLTMALIMALIKTNPHYTTRDIANILSISNSTVYEHLRKNNLVSHYDVWVPHDLTEKNLIDRVSICDSLVKRNQNDPFLKRIITGDEKWVLSSLASVGLKRP